METGLSRQPFNPISHSHKKSRALEGTQPNQVQSPPRRGSRSTSSARAPKRAYGVASGNGRLTLSPNMAPDRGSLQEEIDPGTLSQVPC